MQTQQHPILDLLVNEDGTQMWYQGKLLNILTYQYKRDNYPRFRVNFAGRTHVVEKLVCETWNGMRTEMWQVVKRRDQDPNNNHYTNLYWGKRGDSRTIRTKRCSNSKVKKNEIPEVVQRITSGEPMSNIARSFNTSATSIARIKRRYVQDRLLKLKEAIRSAKTPHQRQSAYAKYLGYKTVADAIAAHGRRKFNQSTEALAVTI